MCVCIWTKNKSENLMRVIPKNKCQPWSIAEHIAIND